MSQVYYPTYLLGSAFLVLVFLYAFYSHKYAQLVPYHKGRHLKTIAAILFLLAGVNGAMEILIFQGRGFRIVSLLLWTSGLFVIGYDVFHTRKVVGRIHSISILKTSLQSSRSILAHMSLVILAVYTIPVSLWGVLSPDSSAFSWHLVVRYFIWTCCFAGLTITARARVNSLIKIPSEEKPEEVSLLPDDAFVARAYCTIIKRFLKNSKPVTLMIEEKMTEFFEHNPILFQGCRLGQDGSIDFEPVMKNIQRVEKENRTLHICQMFSALSSLLLRWYGNMTSPRHSKEVLAVSFNTVRASYGHAPVFLEILRSLPEGVMEEERVALLSKEELEARVRARTRELEEARDYQDKLLEDLRDAEANLRHIITRNVDGIVIVNRKGIVRFVNPAAESLFERKAEEWLGKAFEFPVDPDRVIEFEINRKNGKPAIAEIRTVKIEWEEEKANLSSIRDITDRKILEEKLRQSQKMEAVGTLAGGIAHDFNNILGIIMANTEVALYDAQKGSVTNNNLNEIRKASLRARDLVKQVLAFSRQSDQKRMPLNMGAVIKESLKMIRSSIPTTIEIQADISGQEDTVNADLTQINQILLNLCTNATYAMKESGGILGVRLETVDLDEESLVLDHDLGPGKYLRLTVSDTGHGIPPDALQRIFDPYFTTKDVGEGTGMGLAVVHGIVKKHGGFISVDSELGKGTAFHIFFPAVEAGIHPDNAHREPLPTGDERILLVDDEKAIIDAVQPLLERLGYQVTSRTSSIEALEAFRHKRDFFDLIITDMTMPNMTGMGLAKELKKIRPEIPIILCTGFSDMIEKDKIEEMGISAITMKPLVMKEMAASVRAALSKL